MNKTIEKKDVKFLDYIETVKAVNRDVYRHDLGFLVEIGSHTFELIREGEQAVLRTPDGYYPHLYQVVCLASDLQEYLGTLKKQSVFTPYLSHSKEEKEIGRPIEIPVIQGKNKFFIHEGGMDFCDSYGEEWMFDVCDVTYDEDYKPVPKGVFSVEFPYSLPNVVWRLFFVRDRPAIVGEGFCAHGIKCFEAYFEANNEDMVIEFLGSDCVFPHKTESQLIDMISGLAPQYSQLLHSLSDEVPIGYLLGILCGLTPGYEQYRQLAEELLYRLEVEYASNAQFVYPYEEWRKTLRDKIVVLEDIEKRNEYYRRVIGSDWDESFREIIVRNWLGEERYLSINYGGEFMMFASRYSQMEIREKGLWDEKKHDLVFSVNDESYPGCTAEMRYTPEYAVLSEAWSTPYYELFRRLVNSYKEEPKFRIITLCGSTKFKDEFLEIQKRLTLEGNIVISVGLFGHSGDDEVWAPGTKEMLDEMHKRKIDMANEIFVINRSGYIGESTKAEIEYAKSTGKAIRYLETNYDR